MGMAGKQRGMDDDIFLTFLDMVRILNFLQAEHYPAPLYLFENTWPGHKSQYPRIDKASEMIESFLGALVIINAMPQDILPSPSLAEVLHPYHVSTTLDLNWRPPFITHSHIGEPSVCLPTIVTFPKSHAYRPRANGEPGEGQLWNAITRKREEPTLAQKEQLTGYRRGDVLEGLAT